MCSFVRVKTLGALVGAGVAVWLALAGWGLPDARPLREKNPTLTALMEQRAAEAGEKGLKARRRQTWVPLSAIARSAVAAVVVSEDAAFYQHSGVDEVELKKALGEAWQKRSLGRGASTITQQLAKNLWLSTDRSVLRKLKELVLAKRLEAALSKTRILTLYLNVVEWGDGVYGIEAAAEEHFGVHAAELTPAQGAMLAAMLPSPRTRLPRLKPRVLHRTALRVLERLASVGRLDPIAAGNARLQLDAFFGLTSTADANAPEDELEDSGAETKG